MHCEAATRTASAGGAPFASEAPLYRRSYKVAKAFCSACVTMSGGPPQEDLRSLPNGPQCESLMTQQSASRSWLSGSSAMLSN
jgi:hypothetical protein